MLRVAIGCVLLAVGCSSNSKNDDAANDSGSIILDGGFPATDLGVGPEEGTDTNMGPTCSDGLRLSGVVSGSWPYSSFGGGGGSSSDGMSGWMRFRVLDQDGVFYMYGTGAPGTGVAPGIGLLIAPTDAVPGGTHACIGEGSTYAEYSQSNQFSLKNVVVLGACEGKTSTDVLDLCFSDYYAKTDPGAGCTKGKTRLTGTVGGAAVDVTIDAGTGGSPPFDLERQGVFVMHTPSGGRGTLAIQNGAALDVYCIGNGTYTYGSELSRAHLEGVTKLGSCNGATASGTIQGCMHH